MHQTSLIWISIISHFRDLQAAVHVGGHIQHQSALHPAVERSILLIAADVAAAVDNIRLAPQDRSHQAKDVSRVVLCVIRGAVRACVSVSK